jgi:hypothetical protein
MCADRNTMWHEIPLRLTRRSSSGDVVFQTLLFVPQGQFECTAFASSTTVPAATTWLSGYGDNLVIRSDWCNSALPASISMQPVFQTAVAPDQLGCGGNFASLPRAAGGSRRSERQRSFAVPWFVGRYNEAATCGLLTQLCNILAGKLAAVNFNLKQGGSPPNTPNAFAVSPAAAAFAGVMTACVLMQHIDPSLLPTGDVDVLACIAGVVAEALRCHGMPNIIKVIHLCTGYTGEKVNEVLASFEGASAAQDSDCRTTFDFQHQCIDNDGAQEHGRIATPSRVSEAVLIILRWSLSTVPALRDLLGPFHGPMTLLALEIADAVMDAHRWHAVVPRALHVLTQSMTVVPSVVGWRSLCCCGSHRDVERTDVKRISYVWYQANATQRIVVSNMIMKLLSPSLTTMPSSPSPILVSTELSALLPPLKAPAGADHVTEDDVRRAFAAAIASTLMDTVDSMQDVITDHYLHETEPSANIVVPLEALLAVVIRLHQAHCSMMSRQRMVEAQGTRIGCHGSCQPSPPASLLETSVLVSPTRFEGPSLFEPSTLVPCQFTDARSKLLSFSSMAGEDQEPLPVVEMQSCGPTLAPVTVVTEITVSDGIMEMWRKITVAVVSCAVRIPPHHRDGSVRDEYHRVVECCLQLCNWPALTATLLRQLVKVWPHKSSRFAAVILAAFIAKFGGNVWLSCGRAVRTKQCLWTS